MELKNDGILNRLKKYQKLLDSIETINIVDIVDRLKMKDDQLEDKVDQHIIDGNVKINGSGTNMKRRWRLKHQL